MLDLSIIIVTYNVKHYLVKCLQSICSCAPALNYEILVVDNCSHDGSAAMVKGNFPEVKLLENDKNLGFSKANNQAMARSRGRYILLLNPDTEVFPSALEKMVAFMDTHRAAGALGARTWSDPAKTFQWGDDKALTPAMLLFEMTALGRLFPKNPVFQHNWQKDWRIFQHSEAIPVETVNGHCLLIRREIISQVGLLDEAFFRYFSDLDWCRRIKNQGWRLFFLPAAEFVHYIGRSPLDKKAAEIFLAELKIYLKKHFGTLTCYGLLAAMGCDKVLQQALRPVEWIKRLTPFRSKPGPTIRFDAPEKMTLTWPDRKSAGGYLLEISTSPFFLYKGATRVKETSFKMPEPFFYEWSDGTYYWRAIPLNDQTAGEDRSRILKDQLDSGYSGCFVKKSA